MCARLRSPSNVELTETHPAEGIPGKHKRRDLFDAADLPPHLNLLRIRRDAEDKSRVPSVILLIVWKCDHLNSTHLIYSREADSRSLGTARIKGTVRPKRSFHSSIQQDAEGGVADSHPSFSSSSALNR